MTGSDPATYTVRLEYPAIAYAYQEVTAASPDEAVELAREMESDGKIIFDEDHETLAGETKRAIFTAAAHAQRAADYLHGLQQPAAVNGVAA